VYQYYCRCFLYISVLRHFSSKCVYRVCLGLQCVSIHVCVSIVFPSMYVFPLCFHCVSICVFVSIVFPSMYLFPLCFHPCMCCHCVSIHVFVSIVFPSMYVVSIHVCVSIHIYTGVRTMRLLYTYIKGLLRECVMYHMMMVRVCIVSMILF